MSKEGDTSIRMDKSFFQVTSFDDESNEVAYWLTQSPEKRLEAVEVLRQSLFDHEDSPQRFQRFFEVVDIA